ncbi:MAG: DUF2703 domain-containing protein [Bacillota bacterium]|jgi:hypothetical protein|nr:DUF2703 domain-containing protein [Bacillota bacterium]HQD19821.1 DUF2703 domain-containing protein [Bacillota bacterium]
MNKESCCSSRCSCKQTVVEYLYLDLQTCERCMGTEDVLDEVMQVLTPVLELAGYSVEYKKIKIETAEMAVKYQFLSSPTIRVNGQDIFQSVVENDCGCCSEICDTDVECRVFEYKGKNYEIPPKEALAAGILQLVFGLSGRGGHSDSYELPANLKRFFAGKETRAGCSCQGNCC